MILILMTNIEALKVILTSTRFKSFYWRLGAFLTAAVTLAAADWIAGYEAGTPELVLLGLALGEISKAISNYANGK